MKIIKEKETDIHSNHLILMEYLVHICLGWCFLIWVGKILR